MRGENGDEAVYTSSQLFVLNFPRKKNDVILVMICNTCGALLGSTSKEIGRLKRREKPAPLSKTLTPTVDVQINVHLQKVDDILILIRLLFWKINFETEQLVRVLRFHSEDHGDRRK